MFVEIGQVVVHNVSSTSDSAEIVAVLVRDLDKYTDEASKFEGKNILFTDDADAFFASSPDLVVEVAGQEAVEQYGIKALHTGADFMVSSIGAFTDDELYNNLSQCAVGVPGNLHLVAGALPGVGWMQGASSAKVYEVNITQTKPVTSWIGTPAEGMVDLHAVAEPVCFFTGTARTAAAVFRKSSNITAMLALSTIGMDKVQVALVADPKAKRMQTLIEFKGEAGELIIHWKGVPSMLNPSTSMDVALNVIKAINNICSSVKLGV